MKKILLDKNKNFYKGNMHCHSTNSDGKKTPEELKEIFKKHGYSFLAITDHEHLIDYSYLNDEDFITITSAEYAIKEFPKQSTMVNQKMKVCHLNFYAKDPKNVNNVCYNAVYDHFSKGELKEAIVKPETDYERVYGHKGISEMIKMANENGFFVCYNHPRWSLENYGDYCGYDGLWGVEIYNTSCNCLGLYEYDINVFDDFLRDGKKIFASCGDDNHNKRVGDHCVAFVQVNADSLTYDNIINALLKGDFYSSTGPEIYSLYVEDNKVYIECSDAKAITISTEGRRSNRVLAENGKLTSAEFEILDSDGYFRIDVIDKEGNRANTQAYFIENLK